MDVNKPVGLLAILTTSDPEYLHLMEPFPLESSTTKIIEVLERHGVYFDTTTGEWK